MAEHMLWSIGAADGRSPDLINNYKDSNMLGEVAWRVPSGDQTIVQAWATDLLEHEITEAAVEADGTLRADVPARGLATVRIVLETARGGT